MGSDSRGHADRSAAVFIEFLKLGHRFHPWVEDCPLAYVSNNAPQQLNVLGPLFLSILSGHHRYAHITALRGDTVNTQLLGMSKVISDDSAIRALKRMDETEAVQWLQRPSSILLRTLAEYPLDTGRRCHGEAPLRSPGRCQGGLQPAQTGATFAYVPQLHHGQYPLSAGGECIAGR